VLQIFNDPDEDSLPARIARMEEKAKPGKLYMPEPLARGNRPLPAK